MNNTSAILFYGLFTGLILYLAFLLIKAIIMADKGTEYRYFYIYDEYVKKFPEHQKLSEEVLKTERWCEDCGSKKEWVAYRRGFEANTGRERYYLILSCKPKYNKWSSGNINADLCNKSDRDW